jgi:ubiquinone/menaquinone biosynthesis C-methylase UbiE
MNWAKYQCLECQASDWRNCTTYWQCQACGQQYACSKGVPRLYVEKNVGERDRTLRDRFYDGLLGRYYRHVMPFLALPVRPAYKEGWLIFVAAWGAFLGLTAAVAWLLVPSQTVRTWTLIDIGVVALLAGLVVFFVRHRYIWYLLLLAVPVKLSLRYTTFRPSVSFGELHARLIAELKQRPGRLQVLDISTGTCNSLYRHGWMQLNADYTGLDLSETMLFQGVDFMTAAQVPMDFVLGDAARLPFRAGTFDVVLNYGALNGFSDAAGALQEMARVAKPGGLILVLDEQLYDSASAIERFYFHRVLSSHNVHHRFPIELLPPEVTRAEVHQVYHFYYIFSGYKQ